MSTENLQEFKQGLAKRLGIPLANQPPGEALTSLAAKLKANASQGATDAHSGQPAESSDSPKRPNPNQAASSVSDAGSPVEHVAQNRKSHIKEFGPPPDAIAPEATAREIPDPTKGLPENFPDAVFPDKIRKIANQLASVYQAPICVVEMSLLATLSAAVGKSAVVVRAVRDLVTTLNLFVVVVAERGTCKSVIGAKAIAPISEFSDSLVEEHRQTVAARKTEAAVLKKETAKLESEISKAGPTIRPELLGRLSDKHQKLGELESGASRDVTAIVSDITGEALVRALEENKETLFSYSPEAGTVVSVTAGKYRDGKADLDAYLCGYSGDPLRANRVDRGAVVVKQPCLTLLWLMQGIVAMDLVGNRDTIPRGFTARTLFFDSGARREYDNRKDESFTLADEWTTLVNFQLLRRKTAVQPREIVCSPEAREVFAKFYDEGVDWERRWCPDLSGEFSRQRENAVKVAGLFALVEGRGEISADLAERATQVVRWVGYNYLTLIQSERQKRLKKDMERITELLEGCGGQINLGALAQHHGIKREKVEALMVVYPGVFALKKVPQPPGKPGRAAELLCFAGPSADESDGDKIEKIEKISRVVLLHELRPDQA